MRGPYAMFSTEELERIHMCVKRAPILDAHTVEVDQTIIEKIEAAMSSDPKFKEPMT